MKEIEETIVLPTLRALKQRRRIFKGILFPGVMLTDKGPKVIEFNVRFGDPEAQSYMRILSSDIVDILLACIRGTLKEQTVKWSKDSACCVVCSSGGYPGTYKKGKTVYGLEVKRKKNIEIFHAGTKKLGGKIVTSGGRVLGVTATGKNLKGALDDAYTALEEISFNGMHYRKDIGKKSL